MRGTVQIDGKIVEERRELPVTRSVDVLVAGGGTAGLVAAVAAARTGARTLLVERNGFMGGAITAAMMAQISAGAVAVTGIGREIVDRLNAMGGVEGSFLIPIDPEAFKLIALEMLDEVGVETLLYSSVVGTVLQGDRVHGVIVENKSGRQAIQARVTIDATGDGDVCAWADAPIVKGRESDGKMRPVSIIFKMAGVDIPDMVRYAREHPEQFSPDPKYHIVDPEHGLVRMVGYFDQVERAKQNGDLFSDCHYIRVEGVIVERGTVLINATRVYGVDGTDAGQISRAELDARRQAFQVAAFMRDYVPGFEKAYLAETASSLGIRETRHVIGDYLLAEDDILNDVSFPDAVVRSFKRQLPGEPSHSPDAGEGAATDPSARSAIAPVLGFSIPYRSFLPRGLEGILVTGRCISQTHKADGYTRLQSTVWAMGEAVGVAAALAVRQGATPRQMLDRVSSIREALASQGCGLADEDFPKVMAARKAGIA